MMSVTWIAVKIIACPFTYQLSAEIRPKTSGKTVASRSCRRWIQFITITAMSGRKNSSSRKPGSGSPSRPRNRLPGIKAK